MLLTKPALHGTPSAAAAAAAAAAELWIFFSDTLRSARATQQLEQASSDARSIAGADVAAADVALCAEETEGFLIASIFEAEKLAPPLNVCQRETRKDHFLLWNEVKCVPKDIYSKRECGEGYSDISCRLRMSFIQNNP